MNSSAAAESTSSSVVASVLSLIPQWTSSTADPVDYCTGDAGLDEFISCAVEEVLD